MYRIIRIILIGLLFFSIYLGSNQVGAKNDVFAKSLALCCNNAICHEAECLGYSSILPCVGHEYMATCMDCMDVVGQLRNCGKYFREWPTWCYLSGGTRYYAE